jgi:hypothetical protein
MGSAPTSSGNRLVRPVKPKLGFSKGAKYLFSSKVRAERRAALSEHREKRKAFVEKLVYDLASKNAKKIPITYERTRDRKTITLTTNLDDLIRVQWHAGGPGLPPTVEVSHNFELFEKFFSPKTMPLITGKTEKELINNGNKFVAEHQKEIKQYRKADGAGNYKNDASMMISLIVWSLVAQEMRERNLA